MATTKGPGEFISTETMREIMLEQKRPRIGGMRLYGDEWDDYYIPRGWKASQPMLNSDVKEQARNIILKSLEKGTPIEDQLRGKAKAERPHIALSPRYDNISRARRVAGRFAAMKAKKQKKAMSGFVTMGDLADLGQDVDIITAVRDIHGAVMPATPILSAIGNYPYATIAGLMLVIGIGAYLGGFVGSRGVEVLMKKLKEGKVVSLPK